MYSTLLSLKSLVEKKKQGALKVEVFMNESPGLDQISSNECKHGTPTNTLFSSKDTKVFFFCQKVLFSSDNIGQGHSSPLFEGFA